MSTTFSGNVLRPTVSSSTPSTSLVSLAEFLLASKLLFEQKKSQPQTQTLPSGPRYGIQGTFLKDEDLRQRAFEMVAGEERGTIITKIEGIEPDINKHVIVVLKTPKVPEGLGLAVGPEIERIVSYPNARDERKKTRVEAFVWNNSSPAGELKRLKERLEEVYYALSVKEVLHALGYDVDCKKTEKGYHFVGNDSPREVHVHVEKDRIFSDLGGFRDLECFEEAEVIRKLLDRYGIAIGNITQDPKDSGGEIESHAREGKRIKE
jgi:hypothetical protein